ncbi:MAG: hydrogenase iron-sulfur subunit, partial [Deltaproteobacteria bacterium]|nr:hydrogenase iron-sulfur subunit [Deltaproteobacteria bacterium]
MAQVNNTKPSMNADMEEISMNTTVLVIGGGWNGIKVASELVHAGSPVILVDSEQDMVRQVFAEHLMAASEKELADLLETVKKNEEIEVLTSSEILSLGGAPGDFHVRLEQDGNVLERNVGAVVVALEAQKISMTHEYGLDDYDKVLSQSDIELVLASDEKKHHLLGDGSKDVLFLVGLKQEGNPVVMERAIQSAIDIQNSGEAQATMVVGNVKLAHNGLEALYKQSREKGVLYFKLRKPPQIKLNGSSFSLTFHDSVLYDNVELRPDVVVVEEAISPHRQTSHLAQMLRVETDTEGFFQSDNVHFFPIRSNREGIYVIGSARQSTNLRQGWADAQNAVLEISQLLEDGKKLVPVEKAKIHRGKCTICLTCYRVCPHGAISWDNRAVISSVACQGCGICASECPMDAIQLIDYQDAQIKHEILATQETGATVPQIIAFCCRNSAYEAGEMARIFGNVLPEGLQMIKVPCAGKVDVDYILTAFQAGADGVLVFACHKDNCKSQWGNTFAEWRVEDAVRMLEEIGLERERLQFATIA